MDNITQRINMTIENIMADTTPITYNFTKTPYYYVCNLYENCKFIIDVSITEFFTCLCKLEKLRVEKCENIEMSLVCLATNHNSFIASCILKEKGEVATKKEKTKDDYSDFSDEEMCIRVSKAVPINKNTRNIYMNQNKRRGIDFNDYKSVSKFLITAFKQAVIIPNSSLNIAVSESNLTAFDYKKSVCKTGRHPHGTLSKFIACCDDIFELVRFSGIYIMRIDYEAKVIIERRKNNHIKNLNGSSFKQHLEAMIVNMFPTKVTIPYTDLLDIFKLIYGISLTSLSTEDPINLLSAIESPNLYFTKTSVLMVTLIPVCSAEYKNFGDISDLLKIHELDKNSSDVKSKQDSVVEEKPNVFEKMNVDLHGIVPISKITEIAAQNIPSRIQIVNTDDILLSIYKDHERKNFINPEWIFIAQNVKFDEHHGFFN